MHQSLIALTLISITLIIIMLTCFICFTRWRRKEEEELMEQVQYSTNQQQQQQQGHSHQLAATTPIRDPSNTSKITSNSGNGNSRHININNSDQQRNSREQIMVGNDYQSSKHPSNPYISVTSSPYHQHHSPTNLLSMANDPMNETRSDITQQINSAIIGSSEAEFQNDFIQVCLCICKTTI